MTWENAFLIFNIRDLNSFGLLFFVIDKKRYELDVFRHIESPPLFRY